MTIAVCYLSADGVIFGADSTTTMHVAGNSPSDTGSVHHYNYAQKVFEIGQSGTLALTMWGLGNLLSKSYRTLIANFADDLLETKPASVEEVANRWNSMFSNAYTEDFSNIIQRYKALCDNNSRSPAEDKELSELEDLSHSLCGGFCIGGRLDGDRSPSAFEINYNLKDCLPLPPSRLEIGSTRFWGCPSLIERVLHGVDFGFLVDILGSGKWQGTQNELFSLLAKYSLGQPRDLPIREAIDWVHASIYTTIKTMKFSHMAPVCGGPIEVGVITTDRPFRWVRHKSLDAAICEGGI